MQLDLFAGVQPLPERVRVISLHEPYATLVVNGIKTIETRTWDWPYEPSWLAIHAAKRFDKDAFTRLRMTDAYHAAALPGGGIVGLVWVASSRILLPSDEAAACFYAPNRFAWILTHATRFAKLVPFPGPQKFSSVDRSIILSALEAA